jgi:F0F1-type ATP synthase assembly protein I
MDIEFGKRDKATEATDDVPQDDVGKMEVVDDAEMEQFYGSATSDAYRLKSELVSQCMTEIGMGWYLLRPLC